MEAEKTTLMQAMSDAEKVAALRFCETCDDDEGYDVPRQMMKRLETFGLVIDKKFGRFEQTELLLDVRDELEAWALVHNDLSHRDAQGSLRGSGGLAGSATGGK